MSENTKECKECGTAKEQLIEVFTESGKATLLCQYCIDHYCSLCEKCNSYIHNGLCRRLDNCVRCNQSQT